MLRRVSLVFFVLMIWFNSHDVWGWSSRVFNQHGALAEKVRERLELPSPSLKRCEKKMDFDALKKALKEGAAEPDIEDGQRSDKHSYNPVYNSSWNNAIRTKLNLPDTKIEAGAALDAIEEEGGPIEFYLSPQQLNCKSGDNKYVSLWRRFGRLSHYASDLASPLHAYSVSVNRGYQEGDYINGEWVKGLYELGKGPFYTPGAHFHWQSELALGEAINSASCEVPAISPESTVNNARAVLNGYPSPVGNGTGFLAMIRDYETNTNINVNFFREKGPQQVRDALGVIKTVWGEVLKDFEPFSCEERDEDCEPEPCTRCDNPSPGRDHPDDKVDVSNAFGALMDDESVEQMFDRLGIKKNKRSLLWFWMQDYLVEEYHQGNIDYETYKQILDSYGLTAEIAWELFYRDYLTSPDVAVLGRGFALSLSDLIQNNAQEPVRRFTLNDFSPDALKDYPVFIIPSGGLMGMENSEIFRANLDEYVKRGGTLIVFAQQHGYEFSALPVPEEPDGSRKSVKGYGWTEDQSCFTNGAYIETWHPVLAGQSRNAPTLNLDGYFTDYPSEATVLLRRTSTGQPAMILYPYGEGRVIVTSMYSDFAYGHNQASGEEIALIRDMIAWAKKPTELVEIKPGESASVSVTLTNHSAIDAASAKLLVYGPGRAALLSEQTLSLSIQAGQSSTVPIGIPTTAASTLGIYPIDYVLYEANGLIIQPEGETDSGRFAVSDPPPSPGQISELTFSVQSDSEQYAVDSTAVFTIIAFNRSDRERTVTAQYDESRTETLLVPAGGQAVSPIRRKYIMGVCFW